MPPYRYSLHSPKRVNRKKTLSVKGATSTPSTQNTTFIRSLNTPSYYLPPTDYNNISLAVERCYAPSTLDFHSRTLQHFTQFCDEREIPKKLRFPTHEVILLAYAASHIGRSAGATARQRISALKTYHLINNLTWNGSPRLSKVLNGITLSAPKSSTRPPRAPITSTMLKRLLENLDLESGVDAAVAACACTAFWGQCRLGELLPTSSTSSPTATLPTRGHLTRPMSRKSSSQSFDLHLPCTKTNRRGQSVTLLKQSHASNPLPLLQHHLSINKLPSSSTLFGYLSSSTSTPTILSKRRFLARCNAIWSKLGYDRITGHSFRIGGTSKLLSSGIPPDVVKTMGRWSSDSFLRYWRQIDKIAPAQTPHLLSKHHKRA